MPRIFQATTAAELNDVRSLMRGFLAWHRVRHESDIALVNRYFDEKSFEAELGGLPGKYNAPHGALLIAYHLGRPAGCVALHNLGVGICEMKRMFVADAYRGLRIGRALAERAIVEAKNIGYRAMRLDTSHRQAEARGLYEATGFRQIEPYYNLPPEMRDWLVFYERDL
jgi:GNAT superfamily N-acetyltransferase